MRLEPSDSAPHRTKLDQLMERRDAIYENLRDLRFEYPRREIFRKGLRGNQAVARNRSRPRARRYGHATGSTPTPATRQAAAEKARSS